MTRYSGCKLEEEMRRALAVPGRRDNHALRRVAMKILLVEDNEMNLDMLSRRLVRRGHAVVTAVDGRAAVQTALRERPDVVLMDMGLPVMDGWEAAGRIKADARTASIPVIALTAHAMAEDRERALAAGCEEFDTKPVDLERLCGKIAAVTRDATQT